MKERVPQDAPASPADVRAPTPVEYRDLEVAKNCMAVAVAYLAEPATPHTLAMAMINATIAIGMIQHWDEQSCRTNPGRSVEIARRVAGNLDLTFNGEVR